MPTETETKPPLDRASAFRREMTGNDALEETTSTTTLPLEESVAETTTLPTEEPKAAPEAKPKPRRAKGFEDVPEIVSGLKEATKALNSAAETIKAKPQEKVDEFIYTEDENDQLETLAAMEDMSEKYKGIAARARKFIQTVDAHEAKILKEKPDISDEDLDEALAEYRNKMGVKWSDSDFRKAEIHREVKPLKEQREKLAEKMGKIEADEHQEKLIPVAEEEAARAVREDVVAELGDQFKGLVGEDGEVVKEVADKIAAEDPLLSELVLNTVTQARDFAKACVIAFNGGQTDKAQAVVNMAKYAESLYIKLPVSEQINEQGQRFARRAAWNAMDADEKSKHWIIGPGEIIPLVTDDLVNKAKAQMAKIKERDQKKYPTAPVPKTIEKPISPASVNPAPPVTTANTVAKGFLSELRLGTSGR